MGKPVHYLAVVLVLAMQAGDSSCAPAVKDCQIDTRGIRVEVGLVTDVLTATCDVRPRSHRLDGWLEYRSPDGDTWVRRGEVFTSHTRPGPEGSQLRVNGGLCVPGDWRAAWQATGIGPGLDERSFDYRDGDVWPTPLDCEG